MVDRSISFPESTELLGLVFTLTPEKNASLFPDYAKGLHAWFLDRVRQDNPELSQYLHDGQSEKPFTISRLQGKISTDGKQLYLSVENTYLWYVTALSQPVVAWMQDWLKHLPDAIALRNLQLQIQDVAIAQQATTYDKLFKTRSSKNLTLSFVSPTSFRSKGHHFPLPVPTNLFHSYLRRWNHFAPHKFDAEAFLPWIEENVIVISHQLESAKVAGGKKGSVTGFIGAIELSLAETSIRNPEYVQLYKALGQLAPYCGTGHKTTFGLGQTKLEWNLQPSSIATLAAETILTRRIEEIFELLMQKQKRVGGERATQVCQTRATIMARRESGESLLDIAQDLEMPYETVKTYVKLTRRILNS
jgi:CRISPR-associated endoribonuclease Cas6